MAVDIVKEWFAQEREDLLVHNQDKMVAKCGKKGSGKSYSTVIEGEKLCPGEFSVTKHMAFFHPWAFMRVVRRAKKGQLICFDDAGVGLDNREWQKKSNKLIVNILQVMRTKNLWVVFTVPDFGFVDVKGRKLFDLFCHMQKRNKYDMKHQQSRGRYYTIESDAWSGELWRRKLAVVHRNRSYEVSEISYPKPADDVCLIYEEHRARALDRQFGKIEEAAKGVDRAVTIGEAAKLLQMETKLMYNIVRRGYAPIYRESSVLKIPFGWIKKVGAALGLDSAIKITGMVDGDADLITTHDNPRFELPDNNYLVSGLPLPKEARS